MDLIDFVWVRLEEDEERAPGFHRLLCLRTDYDAEEADRICNCGHPARVLREVEAKRRIVAECVPHVDRADDCGQLARGTLFAFALLDAEHPDYREEWRP